jgi:glycine cleavage system aminomethyltransferase T
MPAEIGEERSVDYRHKFLGRRALMHASSAEFQRRMICLRIREPKKVIAGSDIFYDKMPIGRITSVSQSLISRATIALGFVNAMRSEVGTEVFLQSQVGMGSRAEIIRPPGQEHMRR